MTMVMTRITTRTVPAISDLTVDNSQRSIADLSAKSDAEKAVLVHIHFNRQRDEESLAELDLLARSAGALPVAEVTGSRRSPDPAPGAGRAAE